MTSELYRQMDYWQQKEFNAKILNIAQSKTEEALQFIKQHADSVKADYGLIDVNKEPEKWLLYNFNLKPGTITKIGKIEGVESADHNYVTNYPVIVKIQNTWYTLEFINEELNL